MKDIIILGIESSCDETSVAIVKNGREVLSNVINTQISIHELYGGVVYSQKVLLKLVEKGYSREEAYRIVQSHALAALNGGDFKAGLLSDRKVIDKITEQELEECFDTNAYMKNINKVFARFEE